MSQSNEELERLVRQDTGGSRRAQTALAELAARLRRAEEREAERVEDMNSLRTRLAEVEHTLEVERLTGHQLINDCRDLLARAEAAERREAGHMTAMEAARDALLLDSRVKRDAFPPRVTAALDLLDAALAPAPETEGERKHIERLACSAAKEFDAALTPAPAPEPGGEQDEWCIECGHNPHDGEKCRACECDEYEGVP